MQDYKSLHLAVMICAPWLTHRHTERQLLTTIFCFLINFIILLAQLGELKTRIEMLN